MVFTPKFLVSGQSSYRVLSTPAALKPDLYNKYCYLLLKVIKHDNSLLDHLQNLSQSSMEWTSLYIYIVFQCKNELKFKNIFTTKIMAQVYIIFNKWFTILNLPQTHTQNIFHEKKRKVCCASYLICAYYLKTSNN